MNIVGMVDGFPIGKEERAEFQRKHTEAMMDYLEWNLDSDTE